MEQRQQHQGGQGNGFLLGVIVGVLLTLLFTTKRGRAILKDVVDHGFEKFSNLESLMKEVQEKEMVDEEDEAGDDYVAPQPVPVNVVEQAKPASKKTEPAVKEAETVSGSKEEIIESPHVVETPLKEASKPKEVKKEEVKETVTEEKAPKPTHGKRWFRGLRKRS